MNNREQARKFANEVLAIREARQKASAIYASQVEPLKIIGKYTQRIATGKTIGGSK